LREAIIAQQENRWVSDLQSRFAEGWTALHREVAELLRVMVPLPWAEFVQGVLLALEEVQQRSMNVIEAERQAAITEALEHALRRETLRLNANALRDDHERLAQLFGAHWAALQDVERRYLGCAQHCAALPEMMKFALLELGCGVEWSLLQRMLKPLQAALREHPHQLPPRPADARPDRLHAYLASQGTVVMLGDVVRGFTEASKLLDTVPKPGSLPGILATWLAQCPNPAALRASPARQQARRAALHALSEARNAVAHPKSDAAGQPTPAPDLNPHWQAIVADEADAFFRYFPDIFSSKAV
jgi:hypothetical protein